jgi:hypothetical protein
MKQKRASWQALPRRIYRPIMRFEPLQVFTNSTNECRIVEHAQGKCDVDSASIWRISKRLCRLPIRGEHHGRHSSASAYFVAVDLGPGSNGCRLARVCRARVMCNWSSIGFQYASSMHLTMTHGKQDVNSSRRLRPAVKITLAIIIGDGTSSIKRRSSPPHTPRVLAPAKVLDPRSYDRALWPTHVLPGRLHHRMRTSIDLARLSAAHH